MAAATRPVRLAALGLALTLAACGGGGGDGGEAEVGGSDPPGSPVDATDPASLCTAVLNERDEAVALAGREAALDVVLWTREEDEPPAAEDAEAGIEAMAAWRDGLAADRERLAGAEVEEADAEDWELVVGLIDDEVERLEDRIAILEADDWAEAAAGIEIGGPAPDEEESAAVEAAFEALGLTGRDCELVAVGTGTPAEGRGFVAEAATVCAAIVSRRAEVGYREDRDRALEVLVAIIEEEAVGVDGELAGAVDRVLEEWEATQDDLAGIDAADAPDPEGWEQVLRLAEDRVRVFSGRAQAIETGDQDEIAAAFDPELIGEPGWEGFEPNHLGQRDCRSVEA